jgi:hypothetical protein
MPGLVAWRGLQQSGQQCKISSTSGNYAYEQVQMVFNSRLKAISNLLLFPYPGYKLLTIRFKL